jgi:hypothetical protein
MDVMKCLRCGTSPAWITYPMMTGAAASCECSNPQCTYYSPGRWAEVQEVAEAPQAPAQIVPPTRAISDWALYTGRVEVDGEEALSKPAFIWCTHHHDFGD